MNPNDVDNKDYGQIKQQIASIYEDFVRKFTELKKQQLAVITEYRKKLDEKVEEKLLKNIRNGSK